jgi:hypothetical protein
MGCVAQNTLANLKGNMLLGKTIRAYDCTCISLTIL